MATETTATAMARALAEIIWELGAQGLDGVCCAGLSLVEHRTLSRLVVAEACTLQALGEGASLTKSGATRLVDRLEERGLLSRERSPEDGRVCCILLTPEGRSALDQANTAFTHRIANLLANVPDDQRQHLQTAVPALAAALRREIRGNCC